MKISISRWSLDIFSAKLGNGCELDKYYDRIDVLDEFESLRPGLVADWL